MARWGLPAISGRDPRGRGHRGQQGARSGHQSLRGRVGGVLVGGDQATRLPRRGGGGGQRRRSRRPGSTRPRRRRPGPDPSGPTASTSRAARLSRTPPSASTRTRWPGSSSEATAAGRGGQVVGGRLDPDPVQSAEELVGGGRGVVGGERPPGSPRPGGRPPPAPTGPMGSPVEPYHPVEVDDPRARPRRSAVVGGDVPAVIPGCGRWPRARRRSPGLRRPCPPCGSGGWSRPAGRPTPGPGRSGRRGGTAARRAGGRPGAGRLGDGSAAERHRCAWSRDSAEAATGRALRSAIRSPVTRAARSQ